MIRYYSNDAAGRHLGLLRHLTGDDGAGVEYLDHSGRWTGGRSLLDLQELDEIGADEARRIAREQYGVTLAGA